MYTPPWNKNPGGIASGNRSYFLVTVDTGKQEKESGGKSIDKSIIILQLLTRV
jgi:hypothetical protein